MDVISGEKEMVQEDEEKEVNPSSSSSTDKPIAAVSPFLFSKDVCDPGAHPGQCGLYNLGNTCFMNSGLQSLLSTTPLVKYFLEQFSPEESQMDTLTTNFHQLVCKFWSGRYSIIYPRDFKNALGLFHIQFQDYRQHDAQEFLALFLDTMHQQMNLKEADNQTQVDSDAEEECGGKGDDKCQLNNSLTSMSQGLSGPPTGADVQGSSAGAETKGEEATPRVEVNNEDSNVSYVIQSELPTLLKSVVRTNSESDLESLIEEPNVLEPILNNASNLKQRIPRIAEFYSKDTKTLNTNVIVTDFDEEELTTDSEKFHKQENSQTEVNDLSIVAEAGSVVTETVKDESPRKGIKDTNIQAEKSKKMMKMIDSDSDEENSIKKMKFECAEKNFQYQALSKIKKDFDLTEQNLHIASMATAEEVKLIKDLGILGSLDREISESIISKAQTQMKTGKMKKLSDDKENKIDESKTNELKNRDKNAKTKQTEDPEDFIQACKKIRTGSLNDDKIAECAPSCDTMRIEEEQEGMVQNLWGSDGAVVEGGEVTLVLEGTEEEEAADKAWEAYIRDNHSIIVSTFQGQFKSTVICSECSHVSVTFEPFMYLSVPLPHASDRQICVIFVPHGLAPTQYLITLTKNDKIKKVKDELRKLIGQPDCELIMTEVLDCHVSRVLEDNVMLRYVNDKMRQIYAFEMVPAPLTDAAHSATQGKESNGDVFSSMNMFTSEDVRSINSFIPSTTYQNQNHGSNSHDIPDGSNESKHAQVSGMDYSTSSGWENQGTGRTSTFNNQTDHMEDNFKNTSNQGDWLWMTDEQFATTFEKSEWMASDSVELGKSLDQVNMDCSGTAIWNVDKPGHVSAGRNSPVCGEDWDAEIEASMREAGNIAWNATHSIQEGPIVTNPSDSDSTTVMMEDSQTTTPDEASRTIISAQWKSCAICLEELEDSELLSHKTCSGTFCHTCLEMSLKHYGEDSYHCPVCFNKASLTEDFYPLEGDSDRQLQTIRILPVSVALRNESQEGNQLVGHPRTIYLPSTVPGEQLYGCVARAVPNVSNYTIVYTDGQGLHCSRCLYTSQCQGCPIPCEGEVSLRPGDCLTLCLNNLSTEQIVALNDYSVDKSMESLRPEKSLSIFDCLEAFTDSEILDEHNPWYCPRCQRNQCAKKTITVWQYPDILIVHLKRFVYHELSSTKVDAEVLFPLEDLNLSSLISGPDTGNLLYDLYSIVCHFGGASAGHYTTFSRHPLDGQWYYYNDEMVSQGKPKQEDYKNAYILFYCRKGSEAKFDLPSLPPEINLNPSCSFGESAYTDETQTLNNRQRDSATETGTGGTSAGPQQENIVRQPQENMDQSDNWTSHAGHVDRDCDQVKIIITDCDSDHFSCND